MLKYFRKNEEEIFQFLSLPNHSKATNPQTIKSHGQFKKCEKPWIGSFFSQTCLFFSKGVFSIFLRKKKNKSFKNT